MDRTTGTRERGCRFYTESFETGNQTSPAEPAAAVKDCQTLLKVKSYTIYQLLLGFFAAVVVVVAATSGLLLETLCIL